MFRKSITGVIILLFLLSSLIPMISSYSSYETNKTHTAHINENGTLSGYVTDPAMNPIEGARVRVYFHETYEENYTDSSGYYHVTNIPICYCLKNATASKEGYNTEWVLLAIGENTTYDFVLTPSGKTLYVGGSGAGNYTTIQSAIDDASDGDTVFVYSGIYYENVIISNSITLIGENRENTVIDGYKDTDPFYRAAIIINSDGVVIRDFTITNEDGRAAVYMRTFFGDAIISNNIISDAWNGIKMYVSKNNNISGNLFFDNWIGIVIETSEDNVVSDNTFVSNDFFGIQLLRSKNNVMSGNNISNNNWGISLSGSTDNTIEKNEISSNDEYGVIIGGFESVKNTISGNNIQDNKMGIKLYAGNNIISYNNIMENTKNAYFKAKGKSALTNKWIANYWGKPKILPQVIIGKGYVWSSFFIDWYYFTLFDFDWRPAREPYDI